MYEFCRIFLFLTHFPVKIILVFYFCETCIVPLHLLKHTFFILEFFWFLLELQEVGKSARPPVLHLLFVSFSPFGYTFLTANFILPHTALLFLELADHLFAVSDFGSKGLLLSDSRPYTHRRRFRFWGNCGAPVLPDTSAQNH